LLRQNHDCCVPLVDWFQFTGSRTHHTTSSCPRGTRARNSGCFFCLPLPAGILTPRLRPVALQTPRLRLESALRGTPQIFPPIGALAQDGWVVTTTRVERPVRQ